MERCTFSQAAQPLPPLDFVLPGLLSGTAGLVVGPGAVGKTFLALQIGIGVALGDPIAAGAGGDALFPAPAAGEVCIILGEDPPPLILHRMQSLIEGMGLHAKQREMLDETLEIHSAIKDDMALLRKAPATGELAPGPFFDRLQKECQHRRLVILDPLLCLAAGLQENDNGDMGALMRRLNQIAHETQCAILALHHVGKASADVEAWEKARGASSLTTSVRLQLNLTPPTGAEMEEFGIPEADRGLYVRVAQVKANYAAPREPFLLRRGRGGVLAAAGLTPIPAARQAGNDGKPAGGRGNAYKTAKEGAAMAMRGSSNGAI